MAQNKGILDSMLRLFPHNSAGFFSKVEGMAADSENRITRVLFCGPHFPASQNYTRQCLQDHPFIQVDDVPLSDVPDVIKNYHICVAKNMRLDSSVISRASQMKLIMQFGVGLEGVDIDAATKHGIRVARIPGDATGNAASCAEMAIYLMLALLKRQKEMESSIKTRMLGEPIGDTLHGKMVFIMGYGNIGIELAKRLHPFGAKVIATNRKWVSDTQVGIVNKTFISLMRKGVLLINISRGHLLDYEAVVHSLQSGHLGGLGTDVTWTEPFDPDELILKFNNVIITPHVAGLTEYTCRSTAKVVGDVVLQLHAGTPLTGLEFVN